VCHLRPQPGIRVRGFAARRRRQDGATQSRLATRRRTRNSPGGYAHAGIMRVTTGTLTKRVVCAVQGRNQAERVCVGQRRRRVRVEHHHRGQGQEPRPIETADIAGTCHCTGACSVPAPFGGVAESIRESHCNSTPRRPGWSWLLDSHAHTRPPVCTHPLGASGLSEEGVDALGGAGDEGRPALLADGVRGGAGRGGDVVLGWSVRRPQRDGGTPAACTLFFHVYDYLVCKNNDHRPHRHIFGCETCGRARLGRQPPLACTSSPVSPSPAPAHLMMCKGIFSHHALSWPVQFLPANMRACLRL
jgi:hypothetical protein